MRIKLYFNSRYKYILNLDTDSKIPLAENIMRVDLDNSKYSTGTYDVIKQGTFLFNKVENTFVFDKALEANVVLYLDFTDLPENARRYITIRSSRIFQDRTIGGASLHKFSTIDLKNLILIPLIGQMLHFYLDSQLWKFSEKHVRINTLLHIKKII